MWKQTNYWTERQSYFNTIPQIIFGWRKTRSFWPKEYKNSSRTSPISCNPLSTAPNKSMRRYLTERTLIISKHPTNSRSSCKLLKRFLSIARTWRSSPRITDSFSRTLSKIWMSSSFQIKARNRSILQRKIATRQRKAVTPLTATSEEKCSEIRHKEVMVERGDQVNLTSEMF